MGSHHGPAPEMMSFICCRLSNLTVHILFSLLFFSHQTETMDSKSACTVPAAHLCRQIITSSPTRARSWRHALQVDLGGGASELVCVWGCFSVPVCFGEQVRENSNSFPCFFIKFIRLYFFYVLTHSNLLEKLDVVQTSEVWEISWNITLNALKKIFKKIYDMSQQHKNNFICTAKNESLI